MKKQKQKYRCMDDWKYGNRKTTGCPTKTFGHDRRCGFTLVELVIVIAIVIILSVISVPIYRNYVDKAKWSECYALCGTVLSAQKTYYSEYGNFLLAKDSTGDYTSYDPFLGIDARGNKYFTWFRISHSIADNIKVEFRSYYYKPSELITDPSFDKFRLSYNITRGVEYSPNVN